ncbi:hypothetical protein T02_8939, partial [Trichinella nativa]
LPYIHHFAMWPLRGVYLFSLTLLALIIRRIVLSNADADDLMFQLRNINLKYCCYMIAQVWDSTSGFIVGQSRTVAAVDNNSLFGTLTDDEILEAVEEDENEDVDVFDMAQPFGRLFLHDSMEQQEKFQLLLLRHICDVAAQKKLSTCRQKLITDYVKYDTN